MALSYFEVTSPLYDVFHAKYLDSGSWKVNFSGSRKVSKWLSEPLTSETNLGSEGVKQIFTFVRALPENSKLELAVGIDTTVDGAASFSVFAPTLQHERLPTKTNAGKTTLRVTLPTTLSKHAVAPFQVSYQHPTINVQAEGRGERSPSLGLPTNISASVFVDENFYVAAAVDYDLLRSGVKDYTVVARRDLGTLGSFSDVIALGDYSATSAWPSVGAVGTWKTLDVAARLSSFSWIDVGVRFNCPRTGSAAALKVSPLSGQVAATVEAIKGSFKVAASAYVSNVLKPSWDAFSFGIKLAYE